MEKKSNTIAKKFMMAIVGFYLKVVYRVKVVGRENIPTEGAVIFCGNHRSILDPQLIMITAKRKMRFLAKKELAKNKFLAWIGKIADVIYVNRDSKDMGAIKIALKTLKSGKSIALFPEGTRNGIEKGEKLKGGAAFFALNSEAKIVPVGIKGGEKPLKKIIISYGKPLTFEEYKEKKKEKETVDEVTNKIMDNILKLTK